MTPDDTAEVYVFLTAGGAEVLHLAQGSEYCWGYLDALSNRQLISVEEFRRVSDRLQEVAAPEGIPRLEERH